MRFHWQSNGGGESANAITYERTRDDGGHKKGLRDNAGKNCRADTLRTPREFSFVRNKRRHNTIAGRWEHNSLKNLISKLDFATNSKSGCNRIKSKEIKRQTGGQFKSENKKWRYRRRIKRTTKGIKTAKKPALNDNKQAFGEKKTRNSVFRCSVCLCDNRTKSQSKLHTHEFKSYGWFRDKLGLRPFDFATKVILINTTFRPDGSVARLLGLFCL